MLLAIPFPTIDPILFQIGPFAVRWYALAYILGIILGWRYVLWLTRKPAVEMTDRQADDFLVWATLGVVLGGRLGYVLFYRPGYYLEHPAEALALWQGGMSFHGGMLGVCAAILLFSRFRKVPIFAVSDVIAVATPIGLFFGRLANFINGELWGRTTDLPWGMIFPGGGPDPRHPSQFYQAAMEGVILFVLLHLIATRTDLLRRRGFMTGAFLAGYAIARLIGEFFREPDAHIGFLAGGITMGQVLSVPMLIIGLVFMVGARKRATANDDAA